MGRHGIPQLLGQVQELVGQQFVLLGGSFFTLVGLLRQAAVVVGDAGQVPGNLQVMPHHGAVLLPAPVMIRSPVRMEPLVHIRRVRVGKLLQDQPGSGIQNLAAGAQERFHLVGRRVQGQNEVDQIGGNMVADGVPVFPQAVVPQRLGICPQRGVVDMREVTSQAFVAVFRRIQIIGLKC